MAPPSYRERQELMDADRLSRTLSRMAHEILERHPDLRHTVLVGVRTRGVPLARRLAARMKEASGVEPPVGALDITLYRDDLTTVGPQPVLKGTDIPTSIDGRTVVLVDDVLFTGRTVRAALDELIDFGRPARIELAVLVDRGHRELPIHADYAGKTLTTTREEVVQVRLKEEDGDDRVVPSSAAPPGADARAQAEAAAVTPPAYPHRHLLGIEPLDPSHITAVLDTAEALREVLDRPIKKVPALRGKTVVNLFYEASTRTRASFEIAEKVLSADSLSIATSTSSVQKGETLLDTAKNLEAMNPDMIVLRHASSGAPHFLARHCRSAIVNAGDGAHEHPTQALLDALTLRQKKGRLAGLRVAIVGDVMHSRVARSNAWLLTKMGAEVIFCAPPTLIPPGIERLAPVTSRIEEAVEGADAIMMLRIQQERMTGGYFPTVREYHARFGLTEERVRLARKDVLILHPGPMNRGVEIASEVADGPYSVILDQVTNGVAVRMAVLYLLLGGSEAA
jgi:aspartate carbamoyltransferase catalytic subunit